MCRWIGLLVLCCAVGLAGCESNAESKESTAKASEPMISGAKPSETNDVNLLKAQISKLQDLVNMYEARPKEMDSVDRLRQQNPELSVLTGVQRWKQIILSSGSSKVTLTDRGLMEAAGSLFVISASNRDTPNGPRNDIDPFSVELEGDEGTYRMDVVARAAVVFPGVQTPDPDYYVTPDLAGLGRAFLPKPAYLPVESMESRMLNSGLIHVEEGQYSFYMISESRVRGVAQAFLTGNKRKTGKPKTGLKEPPIDDIAFYLYGQKIQMTVYPKSILIKDKNREAWYKVDADLSGQIHAQISAG